jgi:hypothetical protein
MVTLERPCAAQVNTKQLAVEWTLDAAEQSVGARCRAPNKGLRKSFKQ